MDQVECVVIGAGVVGLAIARELAISGREVIVLEKEPLIGSETSSRNSEVIHAGIYYPTGSLKAKYCVEGKKFLYRYCAEKGVAHANCGKLIVATSVDQNDKLPAIRRKAAENGVDDLEEWPAERAIEMEPALFCTGALWSPSTGIIDSHGLMLAYQGDAEDHGAFIVLNTPFERARALAEGIVIEAGGEAPMELLARTVINSAGLFAPDVAGRIEGIDRNTVPNAYFCKGSYYTLPGRSPFSRPIYPMPHKDGLGVHVTVDLGGQCKFGPDIEWVDGIDYEVEASRADVFYDAVRRYWPAIEDGSLERGYSGIRPKIAPKEAPAADFLIQGPKDHGVSGLVNLFGMESPGLTGSAAIAGDVRKIVDAL
ncbi:MAG: NAD(P)/FAD-dependent oxidoreductase [Geminicoccaceae bacterium]|nr:NAD(P)/FAD-dependent oxidoreductase [Geminicoccaceae bacterium]